MQAIVIKKTCFLCSILLSLFIVHEFQAKFSVGFRTLSCEAKFVMWSNDKLLHITNVEQFVIAPHDKQYCHVVQSCLSCGAIARVSGLEV